MVSWVAYLEIGKAYSVHYGVVRSNGWMNGIGDASSIDVFGEVLRSERPAVRVAHRGGDRHAWLFATGVGVSGVICGQGGAAGQAIRASGFTDATIASDRGGQGSRAGGCQFLPMRAVLVSASLLRPNLWVANWAGGQSRLLPRTLH
jgi:hypothetical protein